MTTEHLASLRKYQFLSCFWSRESSVKTGVTSSFITELLSQSPLHGILNVIHFSKFCLGTIRSVCCISNSGTSLPPRLPTVCNILICPQSVCFHSPESLNLNVPFAARPIMNRSKGCRLNVTSSTACGVLPWY